MFHQPDDNPDGFIPGAIHLLPLRGKHRIILSEDALKGHNINNPG